MVRVSADSLIELRKRRSAKWRTFPEDVLPLPVAEMDYPIAKPIRDVLIDMMKKAYQETLGYAIVKVLE